MTDNRSAERGTLTADDIRGLIERHSDESGGNGRDFHNGAYVAIADELNARAERTCEEIVRCRDCYYADEFEGGYWCASGDMPFAHVTPNGFCAWAERRQP